MHIIGEHFSGDLNQPSTEVVTEPSLRAWEEIYGRDMVEDAQERQRLALIIQNKASAIAAVASALHLSKDIELTYEGMRTSAWIIDAECLKHTDLTTGYSDLKSSRMLHTTLLTGWGKLLTVEPIPMYRRHFPLTTVANTVRVLKEASGYTEVTLEAKDLSFDSYNALLDDFASNNNIQTDSNL